MFYTTDILLPLGFFYYKIHTT